MEIHTQQIIRAIQWNGHNKYDIMTFNKRYGVPQKLTLTHFTYWQPGDWWVIEGPGTGRLVSDENFKKFFPDLLTDQSDSTKLVEEPKS
jgi:hypothetical protein